MILSFVLYLSAVTLPPALGMWFIPRLRREIALLLPLGIAANLAIVGLVTQITHGFFPSSLLKFIVVSLGGGAATTGLALLLSPQILPARRYRLPAKTLAIVAALAAFAIADIFYIGARQGFTFSEAGQVTDAYFRTPFSGETQRHLVTVNALNRGENSPFLVGGKFSQPQLWHHFTALVVSLDRSPSQFSAVVGSQLALAYVFYFLLFSILALLRPAWLLRPASLPFAVFFTLTLTHGDFAHMLGNFALGKTAGIQSDASAPVGFFNYFSPKALALAYPSEIFFFCFLLGFLYVDRLCTTQRIYHSVAKFFFVAAAVTISPLLSALYFPIHFLIQNIKLARAEKPFSDSAVHALAILAGAMVLAWGVNDSPPWQMARNLIGGETYFPLAAPIDPTQWIQLPLITLVTLGLLGAVVTGLGFWRVHRGLLGSLFQPAVVVSLTSTILLHYVVSGSEWRRSAIVLSSLLAVLTLARWLPSPRRLQPQWITAGAQFVLVVAVGFHAYFIFSHAVKPSDVNPAFAWGDYYRMNAELQKKFPKLPILAVPAPGMFAPVAMEATTSFSTPNHAATNAVVTPRNYNFLVRMNGFENVVPYAQSMGYRAILWGPAEELRWGDRVRNRFIDKANLMAETGSVKLYRIVDKLRAKSEEKWRPASAEFYGDFADSLEKFGWAQEALDNYYEQIAVDPNSFRAHNQIGLILVKFQSYREAVHHFTKAIELNPKFKDAYNNLGAVFTLTAHYKEAIEILQRATAFSTDSELFINLAQAHLSQDDANAAVGYFRRALGSKPGEVAKTHALSGLGDAYSRLGDFSKAITSYTRVAELRPNDASIYLKLGNTFSLQGKSDRAEVQFKKALRLEPNNETAKKAIASLAPPNRG